MDRAPTNHVPDLSGGEFPDARQPFHQNLPVNRHIAHSLLSSQARTHNYSGLLNLGGLILFVSNIHRVVENILKYGLLIRNTALSTYLNFQLLQWSGAIPIVGCLVLAVERLASQGTLSDGVAIALMVGLLFGLIAAPVCAIVRSPVSPFSGILLLTTTLMSWLKLYSYVAANRQYRIDRICKRPLADAGVVEGVPMDHPPVSYPANLTVANLLMFFAYPTLCYQINYPRTPCTRWPWVANKVMQLLFLSFLMIFMLEQWYFPIIHNSVVFFHTRHIVGILERVLKLSVPLVYMWLISFYAFFHLYLNIIAETFRFGDREFYADWWNATTFAYYWRTWNIPTHKWLMRHVYLPLQARGLSRSASKIVVFLLSAALHEFAVSLPLKNLKLYFFFAMLIQVPASAFSSKHLKGKTLGNLAFWIAFCFLGQPVGVLLYHFDYVAMHVR